MIKVKLFRQSRGYCGPACMKMIMGYYGIEKSENYWAKLTKTSRVCGCAEEEIVRVAKELGFKSYIKERSSLRELKKLVARGVPVIVDWFSPEEGGHYSVAVGFLGNKIILADPHFGKIKKHKVEWFEDRWFDSVLRKKGPRIKEIIVIEK